MTESNKKIFNIKGIVHPKMNSEFIPKSRLWFIFGSQMKIIC